MQGIVGTEHVAQAAASIVSLVPAIWSELHAVVWNGLVDFTVLWKRRRGQRQCPRVSGKKTGGALLTVSLRLSMADEDNKARLCHGAVSFLL